MNMPVRKIPNNRRSLTGMVSSQKNERMVAAESSLERDLLVLLEFDPDVEQYEEQPISIEYFDKLGNKHRYTPDVLVYYYAGDSVARPPMLCEVKYREELFAKWKEIKPKIRAGRDYARRQGWRFKIMTEREIRTPYLQSAKFLRPYRTVAVRDSDVRLILDALQDAGDSSPEELLACIHHDRFRRAELLPTLWHLVSHGYICADLNHPLTMHTKLWPPRPQEVAYGE